MRVLLDTHFLLWWLNDSPELGALAREVISKPDNLIFLSAVSLWELRIKEGLGKISLPANFSKVLAQQAFEALSVTVDHTEGLRDLPLHHRDPFDRMLVSQARLEKLTLLTRDPQIARYSVSHILA